MSKKNSNMQLAKIERDKADKAMQKKKFMCEGSKKIIRDRSQNIDRSTSLMDQRRTHMSSQNALNPGLPLRHDRSHMSRASSNVGNLTGRDRSQHNVSTNNYVRDLSGTKMSFLNSTSHNFVGKHVFDSKGERLFSPKITNKSRLMSPREGDTTFYMLH